MGKETDPDRWECIGKAYVSVRKFCGVMIVATMDMEGIVSQEPLAMVSATL